MTDIYTIGHSSHTTEYFLELLKNYEINSVVDIRSIPYSRFVPQYNKDIIRRILNVNKIYCIYMGAELGIVQEDKGLYSQEGYLDFDKVRESSKFTEGMERIRAGFEKGYKIAIMCTEKDPIDCHRSILVARKLRDDGFLIGHILPDGNIENQEQLEKRLLQLYFPDDRQQSFFQIYKDDSGKQELLNLVYAMRNKDLCKAQK